MSSEDKDDRRDPPATKEEVKSGDFDDLTARLLETITCFVCKGIIIDAVCFTACQHTFCGTCANKKLQEKSACPKCGKAVDLNSQSAVRPDRTAQSVVYKLCPAIYWKDLERRKKLCKSKADEERLFPKYLVEMANEICDDKELISFMVEYVSMPSVEEMKKNEERKDVRKSVKKEVKKEKAQEQADEPMETSSQEAHGQVSKNEKEEPMDTEPGPSTSKEAESPVKAKKESNKRASSLPTTFRRYFQCPAGMQLKTLKKLMRMKLYLTSDLYKLHFFGDNVDQILEDTTTLKSIACQSGWKRNKSLTLYFSIQKTTVEEENPPMLEVETMPELTAENPSQPPNLTQNEETASEFPAYAVDLNNDLNDNTRRIITHGPAQKKRKLSSPKKKSSESSSSNSGDGGSPVLQKFLQIMQNGTIFPQMSMMDQSGRQIVNQPPVNIYSPHAAGMMAQQAPHSQPHPQAHPHAHPQAHPQGHPHTLQHLRQQPGLLLPHNFVQQMPQMSFNPALQAALQQTVRTSMHNGYAVPVNYHSDHTRHGHPATIPTKKKYDVQVLPLPQMNATKSPVAQPSSPANIQGSRPPTVTASTTPSSTPKSTPPTNSMQRMTFSSPSSTPKPPTMTLTSSTPSPSSTAATVQTTVASILASSASRVHSSSPKAVASSPSSGTIPVSSPLITKSSPVTASSSSASAANPIATSSHTLTTTPTATSTSSPTSTTTTPRTQQKPVMYSQNNQDYRMMASQKGQTLGKTIMNDLKKPSDLRAAQCGAANKPNQLRLPTVPANSADVAFLTTQFQNAQQLKQWMDLNNLSQQHPTLPQLPSA